MTDQHGYNDPDAPRPAWWKSWDGLPREELRGLYEAATGETLALSDPLPDTLIAHAQQLGMFPFELRFFCKDEPKRSRRDAWTCEALSLYAREYGFDRAVKAAENADREHFRRVIEVVREGTEGDEGGM